jgi:DNA polymerase III sliding clamp (beta) subunit (PCNA family)
VPCEYGGPDLKLGINPDYLRDFLSVVETERVRFEMKDENTQAVGYPVADTVEGENGEPEEAPAGDISRYLCVIMPMRI